MRDIFFITLIDEYEILKLSELLVSDDLYKIVINQKVYNSKEIKENVF